MEGLRDGIDKTMKMLLLTSVLLSFSFVLLQAAKLKSSETHLFVDNEKSLPVQSDLVLSRNLRNVDTTSLEGAKTLRFRIESVLFFRFATVTINSEVRNTAANRSEEITFHVQVPETAFLSTFTMVVDGEEYVAEVMEREAAQKRYFEARAHNLSAGHVEQASVLPERGMQFFTVAVNLPAGGTATFILTYNELLERLGGMYRQRLVVHPGSIVPDLVVSALFTEYEGFQNFAYLLPGSKTPQQSSSEADRVLIREKNINFRMLVWEPTEEWQRSFDPIRGVEGEFVIIYAVSGEVNGGNVFMQQDHFVHFFAPPLLDPIDSNFLFIVDISGSMGVQGKIEQALDAMLAIFNEMTKADSAEARLFNILLFDDKLEYWRESPARSTSAELESAKSFCRDKMKARGGTDIHKALMKGLDIVLKGRDENPCVTVNIIVFLSDGDPTSGETSPSQIVREVTAKNKGRVSIYTLGFGFDLQFEFLKKIAYNNRGFANRVFVAHDAQDQLQGFYKTISRPTLCNVQVNYNVSALQTEDLTVTDFPVYYEGREIIVAGKTSVFAPDLDPAALSRELRVKAVAAKGEDVEYYIPSDNIKILGPLPDIGDLTEKVWAYMKIKSMLREMDSLATEEEKKDVRALALNMSLTFGFVTPLTSFSIVVPAQQRQKTLSEHSYSNSYKSSRNKNIVFSMNSSSQKLSQHLVSILVTIYLPSIWMP